VAEAIVVGAGVVGASVAFHLAEKGMDALVVDWQSPAAGSTARSGALVRAHYPTALEADLAWESLTGYFEPWGERVGGGCGFTRTGFAYLVGDEGVEALRHNVALQKGVGVETGLVGPEELKEIDPALRTEGVALAAYEPHGGYADPTATAIGFLKAALAHGACFERRRVTALRTRGDEVVGVETEDGLLDAPIVVLAAGAWSVPLAAGVGLDLPIQPARVQVALFERSYSLPAHLTLIDSVLGFYARPTAEQATLVGTRDHFSWLDSPDRWEEEPDPAFVEAAADLVSRRVPTLRGAPYRSGRAGVLDMTPDGRPVLAPEGPEGLYLAVGWSGTGFKKAPAVGAELARWILEGAPRREKLKSYALDRFRKGELIFGEHEPGVQTPH
jgi:glycine/D-amino acid oxidase-like deaminating enzyme